MKLTLYKWKQNSLLAFHNRTSIYTYVYNLYLVLMITLCTIHFSLLFTVTPDWTDDRGEIRSSGWCNDNKTAVCIFF